MCLMTVLLAQTFFFWLRGIRRAINSNVCWFCVRNVISFADIMSSAIPWKLFEFTVSELDPLLMAFACFVKFFES